MPKVICDHTVLCKDDLCGGARPHELCYECNRCPREPKAKCLLIENGKAAKHLVKRINSIKED